MRIAILTLATALVFLALDAVALRFLLLPLFSAHIGDLLIQPARLAPAVAFYLLYVAGVVFFAAAPALGRGSVRLAALRGAFLGAVAYGTYELTNYATLAAWHWSLVAVDLTWGTVLTGTTAAAAVWATLRIAGRG